MTEYGHHIIRPHKPNATQFLLTDNRLKEARKARRRLLDQVEQSRKENYKRYYQKMALQQAKRLI